MPAKPLTPQDVADSLLAAMKRLAEESTPSSNMLLANAQAALALSQAFRNIGLAAGSAE